MDIKEKVKNIFPRLQDIPQEHRLNEQIEQTEFLINGKIERWQGDMSDVFSPVCLTDRADGGPQLIGRYPLQTETEALAALAGATQAYDRGRGRWPTMSVTDRIKHVEDFVFRMQEKRAEVIKLLMWEIGKSLKDSTTEFDRTVVYIRDTIEALKDLDRAGSRFTIEQSIIAQIRRAPLGVVLCMGPFNYPLNETFTTLLPALIMGNTVIFKPPKLGVLLHRPLLEAFRDAFPPGVVNSVYGDGEPVIGPLMKSGGIDVLAFIGSCRVADILKAQHPQPHRLRSVLGLSAKNPAIILSDVDIAATAKEVALGALSYNGQRCTALKLIFVHKEIADDFAQALKGEIEKLTVGMPWENPNITPLPEHGKGAYLSGLAQDAVSKGARIVNEQGGLTNRTFFLPALLYPVSSAMRVYEEEQFGPVVPVVPFESIDEPIAYIQESRYGQQVSVFGEDPETLSRLIDPLVNQVCRVNVNCQCQRGPDTFPFTGRKDSAEGTLSVTDALRVFSIRTLVAAKSTDLNKKIVNAILRERHSNFLSTDFIL